MTGRTHDELAAVASLDIAPEFADLSPGGTRGTDRVPDGDGAA